MMNLFCGMIDQRKAFSLISIILTIAKVQYAASVSQYMYVKYAKVCNQELHAELFKQKARDDMEMEYRLIEDDRMKPAKETGRSNDLS